MVTFDDSIWFFFSRSFIASCVFCVGNIGNSWWSLENCFRRIFLAKQVKCLNYVPQNKLRTFKEILMASATFCVTEQIIWTVLTISHSSYIVVGIADFERILRNDWLAFVYARQFVLWQHPKIGTTTNNDKWLMIESNYWLIWNCLASAHLSNWNCHLIIRQIFLTMV